MIKFLFVMFFFFILLVFLMGFSILRTFKYPVRKGTAEVAGKRVNSASNKRLLFRCAQQQLRTR